MLPVGVGALAQQLLGLPHLVVPARLDQVVDQGFADASTRDFYSAVGSIDDLMAALRADLS